MGPKVRVQPYFLSFFPLSNPPGEGCCLEPQGAWDPPPIADVELIRARNYAIMCCFFEIGSCVAGIALNVIRRSVGTQILNVVLFLAACVGLYGAVYLRMWYILGSSICVITFCALVLLYLTLEVVLVESKTNRALSSWIFLGMQGMFVWDFVFACFGIRLYRLMRKRRNAAERTADADSMLVEMSLATLRMDSCTICGSANTVSFAPCGDKVACATCAHRYLVEALPCPICSQWLDGLDLANSEADQSNY